MKKPAAKLKSKRGNFGSMRGFFTSALKFFWSCELLGENFFFFGPRYKNICHVKKSCRVKKRGGHSLKDPAATVETLELGVRSWRNFPIYWMSHDVPLLVNQKSKQLSNLVENVCCPIRDFLYVEYFGALRFYEAAEEISGSSSQQTSAWEFFWLIF